MGLQGGGEGTTNFNVCEREEDQLGHSNQNKQLYRDCILVAD